MKRTYSSGLQIAQILTSTFCASLWSHCTQSLVFGWSWARCCSWPQLFRSRSDDASALVHICARTLWIQSKAQRSGNFMTWKRVGSMKSVRGALTLLGAFSSCILLLFQWPRKISFDPNPSCSYSSKPRIEMLWIQMVPCREPAHINSLAKPDSQSAG